MLAKHHPEPERAADVGEDSEKSQDGADCRESAPERTSYAKKKRLERQGARPAASQRQVKKAPSATAEGAFRTNKMVEPRGIEPLTSWLPAMRSPS